MTPRVHRRFTMGVTFLAFMAPYPFLAFAGTELPAFLGAIVPALEVHPAVSFIASYVLGIAYGFGPALLASCVGYTLVPARCQKCGKRTYRYDDRGKRVRVIAADGQVRYWCPSCGHTENFGYSENG